MQTTNSIQGVLRIYRLALSGLFAVTAFVAPDGQIFEESNAIVVFALSISWFLVASISAVLSKTRPETTTTNTLNLAIDMLALAVLGWAGGGLNSGIHYLMLPSVAIAGLILPTQLALFIAAIASLSVLFTQSFLFFSALAGIGTLFPAGLLGAMLFACTAAFKALERRLSASETRAEISDAKAAEYEQLSDAVIAQMLTGVLVVDDQELITLINPSAEKILATTNSITTEIAGTRLSRFSDLCASYRGWRSNKDIRIQSFTHEISGRNIQPRFTDISKNKVLRTLITLEDTEQLRQQAQQAKVFALGKLSASLAHEVRNPLSAINQANDLLGTSENLSNDDRELVDIIARHCERMDRTIDVTNQLSKRLEPQIVTIDLQPWLNELVTEYQESQSKPCKIHLKFKPKSTISFDRQHLSQVLRNLIDNGLRYSESACDKRDVAILCSQDRTKRLVFIDVHDRGLGIPKQDVENAFAPFQSSSGGAGVGLYLCRELCDANFASINYLYKSDQQESGFFRLTAWINPPNQ